MFSRLLATVEYWLVSFAGKIFGITIVVRYLRNPNPDITVRLMRAYGASIGERVTFKRSVFIDNAFEDQDATGDFRNLQIGRNCYVGDCVYFDLANVIRLEENVVVGGKSSFVTHADCNRSLVLNTYYPRQSKAIVVGDGAWIGFSATLLPGTEIGQCAVVASGALVRDTIEPLTLYAGIPAKKMRTLEASSP